MQFPDAHVRPARWCFSGDAIVGFGDEELGEQTHFQVSLQAANNQTFTPELTSNNLFEGPRPGVNKEVRTAKF